VYLSTINVVISVIIVISIIISALFISIGLLDLFDFPLSSAGASGSIIFFIAQNLWFIIGIIPAIFSVQISKYLEIMPKETSILPFGFWRIFEYGVIFGGSFVIEAYIIYKKILNE
jgi:hypothetical protein